MRINARSGIGEDKIDERENTGGAINGKETAGSSIAGKISVPPVVDCSPLLPIVQTAKSGW